MADSSSCFLGADHRQGGRITFLVPTAHYILPSDLVSINLLPFFHNPQPSSTLPSHHLVGYALFVVTLHLAFYAEFIMSRPGISFLFFLVYTYLFRCTCSSLSSFCLWSARTQCLHWDGAATVTSDSGPLKHRMTPETEPSGSHHLVKSTISHWKNWQRRSATLSRSDHASPRTEEPQHTRRLTPHHT